MNDRANPVEPRRSSLAGWARAADGLALAAATLAIVVALFGRFRLHVAGVRLSITSAPRIPAVALAILVFRHLVRHDAPIYRRLWEYVQRAWRVEGVGRVLPIWTASRLAVLFEGFLTVGTYGFRDSTVPFRLRETSS